MLNSSFRRIINNNTENFAAITLAKRGYSVKSDVTGIYVYYPDNNINDCFEVSQVIDLLQSEEITKVFLYAEHDVATLLFNQVHTNNYVSANSLFCCVEKEFDMNQSLELVKATEYGVIDDATKEMLKQYTIALYRYTLSTITHLHKLPSIRLKRIFGAIEREMRVLPSIVKLNLNGIKFNYKDWEVKLSETGAEYKVLEGTLCSKLNVDNINSPKQLLEGLHRMGINVPNTDETTLKQCKDKILEDIIKYRKKRQIINNYGKKLTEFMDDKFRIYGIYTAFGALTGRMSAKKPAVQSFPRSSKKYFCAEEGNILVTADYKAVEMCILAYLSHCQTMIDEINSGEDLHCKTASIVFSVPMSDVTDEQRQIAKRINFGICYGMTSMGLQKSLVAKNIDVTVEEAEAYIDKYFTYYPKISEWQQACIRSTGITSLGGRYHSLANAKPTQAINFSVQSTGSEICKEALILLDDLIGENKSFKLVSVIHDSITLEVPEKDKEIAENYLKQAMVQAFNKLVPDLNVSVEFSFI